MRVAAVWWAAWAQVALLALFVADAATQWWVGPGLVLPALCVGLLGGTNYIQSMLAIDRGLPTARDREIALATISVGCPVGILLADATGLLVAKLSKGDVATLYERRIKAEEKYVAKADALDA